MGSFRARRSGSAARCLSGKISFRRAFAPEASRADLNFTNALREGLFLLALARAAPIARRLVAPPACSAFNVGLTSAALVLARWNPECRLCGVERTLS